MMIAVTFFLLAFLSNVLSIVLECSFVVSSTDRYTCIDLKLFVDKNELIITKLRGQHLAKKTNANVEEVILLSQTMRFLPRNLTTIFPKLKSLSVQGSTCGGSSYQLEEEIEKEEVESEESIYSSSETAETDDARRWKTKRIDELANDLKRTDKKRNDKSIKKNEEEKKNDNTEKLEEQETRSLDPKALIRGDFFGADTITWLSITSGNLPNLRAYVFEGASKLLRLTLDNNFISSIHKNSFGNISELTRLYLRNNFLSYLHNDTFKPLPNLRRLYLSGNFIQKVFSVHFNPKLGYVDLLFNALEVIDVNLVDKSSKLKFLGMENNICVNRNFTAENFEAGDFKNSIENCTEQSLPKIKISKLEKAISILGKKYEKVLKGKCPEAALAPEKNEEVPEECDKSSNKDVESLKKQIKQKDRQIKRQNVENERLTSEIVDAAKEKKELQLMLNKCNEKECEGNSSGNYSY